MNKKEKRKVQGLMINKIALSLVKDLQTVVKKAKLTSQKRGKERGERMW